MRHKWIIRLLSQSSFNPRICKRCDDNISCDPTIRVSFNPRICKRCDSNALNIIDTSLPVSIHASVKDATTIGHIVGQLLHVSIHASVKDATKTGLFSALWWCFNPRICKRCDMAPDQNSRLAFCFNPRICKRCDVTYPYKYRVVTVSIHASVKDATRLSGIMPMGHMFQSTHL